MHSIYGIISIMPTTYPIICESCGSTSENVRPDARFCNWSCYQLAHASDIVVITCEWCNVKFEPKRESAPAKRKFRFCSRKCRGASASAKYAVADYTDRFWAKVDKTPGLGVGDCWEWTGSIRSRTAKQQRGDFIIAGKRRHAHQVAYELTKGERGDLFVCHRCNNSLCVNPDHLYLGTHFDNMQDRKAAGRYKWSDESKAKLAETRRVKRSLRHPLQR